MPQITKGGKWVFGWVVVGQNRQIVIPPEAYAEYGFQPGEAVIFFARQPALRRVQCWPAREIGSKPDTLAAARLRAG